jgi:small subunit ribosomal protein S17
MALKQKIGQVISTNMQKTVVVKVTTKFLDPTYKKVLSKNKKYLVHDNNEVLNVGDKILIQECRPISKKKSWTLISIISKSSILN